MINTISENVVVKSKISAFQELDTDSIIKRVKLYSYSNKDGKWNNSNIGGKFYHFLTLNIVISSCQRFLPEEKGDSFKALKKGRASRRGTAHKLRFHRP